MSYLVGGKPVNKEIPGEWVVKDLYPQYEEDKERNKTSHLSFHFFEVSDNESLDPEEVKALVGTTTASERAWRFSSGGKFNIQAEGTHVFDPFNSEQHLEENQLDHFDDMNIHGS